MNPGDKVWVRILKDYGSNETEAINGVPLTPGRLVQATVYCVNEHGVCIEVDGYDDDDDEDAFWQQYTSHSGAAWYELLSPLEQLAMEAE